MRNPLRKLRYRLAHWLVGNFVELPFREGIWVVTQNATGNVKTIWEADKFRLKITNSLSRKVYGDPDAIDRTYGWSGRTGRFVGTVKYR